MTKRAKVLVVEDDETMRQMFVDILHEYTVTVVSDGESCLDALGREGFDVLLLDIVLPRKSGISVLRDVKELSPEMPVIVTTGFADIVSQQILAMGVERLVPKPFRADDIRNAVAVALARREKRRP